jgi:hypothetical protein
MFHPGGSQGKERRRRQIDGVLFHPQMTLRSLKIARKEISWAIALVGYRSATDVPAYVDGGSVPTT